MVRSGLTCQRLGQCLPPLQKHDQTGKAQIIDVDYQHHLNLSSCKGLYGGAKFCHFTFFTLNLFTIHKLILQTIIFVRQPLTLIF